MLVSKKKRERIRHIKTVAENVKKGKEVNIQIFDQKRWQINELKETHTQTILIIILSKVKAETFENKRREPTSHV